MDGSLAKVYNKLRPIGYKQFQNEAFHFTFISFYSPIIDLNNFVRKKSFFLLKFCKCSKYSLMSLPKYVL